ncbi:thioredoxin family protein [Collimonas fungivorans]|uniref:Thiol:disulfide interchange protein DsbD n=1 Tax=Collimonas fungivorans TaxID=158899 RepID=A0A127PGB7_9BURK|nr:protein-disulfide reductase DsbD [Collimonas fungivorans]AMO96852.1 thioredoxin family protein [Collimonas fungivorans]
MLRLLRFLLVLLLPLLSWLPAHAENDFLPPEQAFRLNVTQEGQGQVRLNWHISKGYYLYRKQLKVEAEPAGGLPQIEFPVGTIKHDEFFGESEVYHDSLELLVNARDARALHIGWQGCADAGLCYPPQNKRVELAGSGQPPATAAPAAALGEDQSLAARLAQANLAWMLLVFFGLGLLMTFTPCVLPMIPILSSIIAGSGAGPKRGFVLSLAFVLPMALTYAVLGAAAALAGANLQAMLQNPWVLGAFGLVFVALALAMFGFYELQLPAFLRNRLDHASQGQRGGTVLGAATMGVLSALLVGPCMTAPLAGALLYIGDSGDVVSGGLALLSMGLGMGVPLLLVGTLGARLLPRPGNWMNRVKALFGFILLGTAILFLARVLPPALVLGLWGAWLLALALSLLALAHKLAADGGRLLARFLALLLGLWGGLMVIGAAAGAHDPLQPLAFAVRPTAGVQAGAAHDFMTRFATVKTAQQLAEGVAAAGRGGQWTLVDYYADWCVSCKVIERDVFSDPRVQQALAGVQLLRPDITANNADDRAMLGAYQAFGAPTILLIGPDGKEHRAERIIGELSADEFLARLQRAQGKS